MNRLKTIRRSVIESKITTEEIHVSEVVAPARPLHKIKNTRRLKYKYLSDRHYRCDTNAPTTSANGSANLVSSKPFRFRHTVSKFKAIARPTKHRGSSNKVVSKRKKHLNYLREVYAYIKITAVTWLDDSNEAKLMISYGATKFEKDGIASIPKFDLPNESSHMMTAAVRYTYQPVVCSITIPYANHRKILKKDFDKKMHSAFSIHGMYNKRANKPSSLTVKTMCSIATSMAANSR